jgi:hypothetical protein
MQISLNKWLIFRNSNPKVCLLVIQCLRYINLVKRLNNLEYIPTPKERENNCNKHSVQSIKTHLLNYFFSYFCNPYSRWLEYLETPT